MGGCRVRLLLFTVSFLSLFPVIDLDPDVTAFCAVPTIPTSRGEVFFGGATSDVDLLCPLSEWSRSWGRKCFPLIGAVEGGVS